MVQRLKCLSKKRREEVRSKMAARMINFNYAHLRLKCALAAGIFRLNGRRKVRTRNIL